MNKPQFLEFIKLFKYPKKLLKQAEKVKFDPKKLDKIALKYTVPNKENP